MLKEIKCLSVYMERERKELVVDLSSNRKMNPRKSRNYSSFTMGKVCVRVSICKVRLYEANWVQSFAWL